MRRRKLVAAGGVLVWVKLVRDLIGLPGLYDDAVSWTCLWGKVLLIMSYFDLTLFILGSFCFFYAFAPKSIVSKLHFWKWRILRSPHQVPTPSKSVPRVVTVVDPEQSQVSYYGPDGLRAEVFITVENGLDVETRFSKLELEIQTDTERLSCQFLAFQPDPFVDFVEQVSDISIPARQAIKGWACFQHKEGVRIDDFERFVFTAQSIGDPKQEYSLEPYAWDHAKRGNSTLVML